MRLSIRLKLVLIALAILVVVSFGFTIVHLTLSHRLVEDDLRERAVAFAREIAATIGDRREFESGLLLAGQIRQITAVRQNVLHLDILAFDGSSMRVIATSNPATRLPFARRDAREVQQGRVTSRLVTDSRGRYWELMAPVTLEGEVVGAVAAKFSLDRADQLASQIRWWTFGITAVSVVIMGLLMSGAVELVVNRPVRGFLDVIGRIRNGETGATVRVGGADEFGVLASHFNDMVTRISSFNDELRARVQQATAELDGRYRQVERLNEQLFTIQRSLSHAERLALSGQIMAEVAHEIGTPLHSIAGHLELVRKDFPSEFLSAEVARRFQVIESQLGRITEIIGQLLDLVRHSPGEPEPVDVNRLVREMTDLVRPGLSAAALTFRLVTDPACPTVQGYENQLQQVVLNLLTNAMDATRPGGTLEVTTRCLSRGGEAGVEVRDTGHGMSPAQRKRIFEPFFSTKPPGRGTGLGLFIATQIVRDHKGRLEVESEEGHGSVFRMILPAADRT